MAVRDLWFDFWETGGVDGRAWKGEFLLERFRRGDEAALAEACEHFQLDPPKWVKPERGAISWWGKTISIRSSPYRPVVAMTGSARFESLFSDACFELTRNGCVVLCPAFYPAYARSESGVCPIALFLADVQEQRILQANVLYVVSRDHYVGKASRADVDLARRHGKAVLWMEPEARRAVLGEGAE